MSKATLTPDPTWTEVEKIYCGIADCHGIESFRPLIKMTDHDATVMKLRAMCNPQRHAIVFAVALEEDELEKLKSFFSDEGTLDYESSAQMLRFLKKLGLKKVDGPGRLELIPDHKIDPFYG